MSWGLEWVGGEGGLSVEANTQGKVRMGSDGWGSGGGGWGRGMRGEGAPDDGDGVKKIQCRRMGGKGAKGSDGGGEGLS